MDIWEQENNKDFIVAAADGQQITAHKSVLAARSTVFTKMFESGMKEAKENKVEIKDFSFEIIESAIKLCYHYSLVKDPSLENKMKLLQFFDKYDIQSLKTELEEYLMTEIWESNVCRLINGSIISNSVKLQNKCIEFLRECLQENKTINDIDILDKDFAFDFLKNLFQP